MFGDWGLDPNLYSFDGVKMLRGETLFQKESMTSPNPSDNKIMIMAGQPTPLMISP